MDSLHIQLNTDLDLIPLFESIGIKGVKRVEVEMIPRDKVSVCPPTTSEEYLKTVQYWDLKYV